MIPRIVDRHWSVVWEAWSFAIRWNKNCGMIVNVFEKDENIAARVALEHVKSVIA